jgi:UrcA family protein
MNTTNTMIKRSMAALALTAAFTVSLPALANETATPAESSIRVKIRDLDLSKPEGVATLYQRIERSARLVCTDSSSPWDAGRVATMQRCYEAAIQDAVSAINQPQLTAFHQSKTGKPVQVGAASK